MWRGTSANRHAPRLDVRKAACHHCLRETNLGGTFVRLSDNDILAAATLAAAVGTTMQSRTAVDLVSALEEVIDELTRRGGTGAMITAAQKKHFPAQAMEHQHFPDR